MEIIPAIDLIDGKCVRLTEGDFSRLKKYDAEPLEMAKQFEAAGITRLHMVDLDGAKSGLLSNLKVLEEIAGKTTLKIDFGGGVKNDEVFRSVLDAGAWMVAVGSMAVKRPDVVESWISNFGSDKLFLGADVRDNKLAIAGWLDQTEVHINDFVEGWLTAGQTRFFVTDIHKDGKLGGTSLDLYKQLLKKFPKMELTASGGVASVSDIDSLIKIRVHSVIIGKALYEGRITMADLKKYL